MEITFAVGVHHSWFFTRTQGNPSIYPSIEKIMIKRVVKVQFKLIKTDSVRFEFIVRCVVLWSLQVKVQLTRFGLDGLFMQVKHMRTHTISQAKFIPEGLHVCCVLYNIIAGKRARYLMNIK